MNDSHDSGAAGRIRAYVESCDEHDALYPEYAILDRIARFSPDETRTLEVTRADLRAVLAENETMREELELVTAERDSLKQHIDDSIARNAERLARRAKEIADRAEYLARFTANPNLVGEWQPAEGDE